MSLTNAAAVAQSLSLGPLQVEPLSSVCCASSTSKRSTHGIWKELLPTFKISSDSGLFVDVGTSEEMFDGVYALRNDYTVLAIESRKRALKEVRSRFGKYIKGGKLMLKSAAASNTTIGSLATPGDDEKEAKFITLDKQIGPFPCAVIKLDVAGYELEALQGAIGVLQRPKPTAPLVVVSLREELRPDLHHLELLHLLRGLSYKCFDINSKVASRLVSHASCEQDYVGQLRSGGHYAKAMIAASGIAPRGVLFGHQLPGWPQAGAGCSWVSTDFVCSKER